MNLTGPHTRSRRLSWTTVIVTALILGAAVLGAFVVAVLSALPPAAYGLANVSLTGRASSPQSELSAEPSSDDGVLPDGVSVFDDRYDGVARLDPELLNALRSAASEAEAEGIEFQVNSGWRSQEYQAQLQREAVATYGSRREAARWVASPERSAHVSGQAVDIGPFDASYWLEQHGAAFGLCRTYANESWHFELQAEAASDGCREMYADPTEDPALQR